VGALQREVADLRAGQTPGLQAEPEMETAEMLSGTDLHQLMLEAEGAQGRVQRGEGTQVSDVGAGAGAVQGECAGCDPARLFGVPTRGTREL